MANASQYVGILASQLPGLEPLLSSSVWAPIKEGLSDLRQSQSSCSRLGIVDQLYINRTVPRHGRGAQLLSAA